MDVLKIIPGDDELRGCWRADRIRQLRRRTLDEIPTPPGTPRRPQHPNKAPQVTYLIVPSTPISELQTQPTRLRPQRPAPGRTARRRIRIRRR